MNARDEMDLGAILRGHAGAADGPGLGLGDVQKKAGQIRRRRAITAGAGVAAAVAILVPTAMFGGGFIGGDAGDKEPGVTKETTQTPNGEQSIQKGPALDVSDLPRGEAPKVLWLEGDVLHTPDGDVPLPEGQFRLVVPYDDGWAAMDYSAGSPTVVIFDDQGNVTGRRDSWGGDPVASADGRYVLITTQGTLYLHDNETGEEQLVHEQNSQSPQPIGIAYVSNAESGTENQLTAFYNLQDESGGTQPAYWVNGTETVVDGGDEFESGNTTEAPYLRFAAVSGTGWVTAYTEVRGEGSCSTVQDVHGNEAGATCDFTLGSFSPNGDLLIGRPAYLDGFGDGELAILEAADIGHPIVHFAMREQGSTPTFHESVWEDDAHILVVTYSYQGEGGQGTWHLLRIGTDGSVEDAATPVVTSDTEPPFYLP